MGTKNNPGAFDCYANAEPDEPMFILLGRDRSAPYVVAFWAMIREKTHPDEPVKIQDAKDCAKAMTAWAKGQGKDFEALEPVVDGVVDDRLRDLRERVRIAERVCEAVAKHAGEYYPDGSEAAEAFDAWESARAARGGK